MSRHKVLNCKHFESLNSKNVSFHRQKRESLDEIVDMKTKAGKWLLKCFPLGSDMVFMVYNNQSCELYIIQQVTFSRVFAVGRATQAKKYFFLLFFVTKAS